MKNKRLIPCIFVVFSVISMIVLSFACYASVIYKDITSISIRTKFEIDYDEIFDNGLPEIDFFDNSSTSGNSEVSSSNVVYTSSTKYEIESVEWYDNDMEQLRVGGQPRIVCYLVTKDYDNRDNSSNDYYYRFMSSYGSSSCYIGGGTLVSAQRINTDSLKVIFKLKSLKGTYNQPEDVYWADDMGTASWRSPQNNDSGYYDVVLYRENSIAARASKITGNEYNFYSYMTRPGNYMFKIRTVGGTDPEITYGKNSEYVDSTTIYIDEQNVYDPSKGIANYNRANEIGGVTNPMQVGWIQNNNKWYFIRPDGIMSQNTWLEWQGKWYYLGEDGAMKTGWIEVNGKEYYLQSDGAMLVGWLSSGNTYFYFDTNEGEHYGAMCKNMFVNYQGKFFYFDENGIMVTGWRQIKDSNGNIGFYYFYPNGEVSGLFGYMATNTTINGFYVGADGKWVQSSR